MKNTIITIFNEIRDIPFKIPLSTKDELLDCAGKSIMLRKKFEEIGLKTRFSVCLFNWDDLSLPDKINKFPHDKDCTHTFVEALINDKWVKFDPSWDRALEKKLKISYFDGENDTILAVSPTELFDENKSEKIMKDQMDNFNNFLSDDLVRNGEFYNAINNYFAEIREESI